MKHLTIIASLVVAATALTGCKPECMLSCQNGGTETSDCTCDCPAGFSGSDCSFQQTPTGFRLNSITLTSFPSSLWDDCSSPCNLADVRFEINLGVTPFMHTGYISNCNSLYDYTWNDPADFPVILDFATTYDFRIYDYDPDGDDLMLNSMLTMSNHDTGLPNPVYVQAGSYAYKLTGQWVY